MDDDGDGEWLEEGEGGQEPVQEPEGEGEQGMAPEEAEKQEFF